MATTQEATTGTRIATLAMMILLPATALLVVRLAIIALRLIPLGVPVHLTILVPLTVAPGATRLAKYFKVHLQTSPFSYRACLQANLISGRNTDFCMDNNDNFPVYESDKRTYPAVTPEEALKVVEAGMGLAGCEITDPYINNLLRQCAYGELTFEEYSELCRKHILGDN